MCKPGKGVKEKSPDKEEEEEGLTMRRMTEAIKEWAEGDRLMCIEEDVWIHAHENMATKLAIEAKIKKEKRRQKKSCQFTTMILSKMFSVKNHLMSYHQ